MEEIVQASPEDKEQIMQLYRAQIGREFCFWDEHYPSYETIDFDLGRDALFLMKDGDRIIAAISIDEDEDVESLDCWSEELSPGKELARLVVAGDMQNNGIARKMLEYGMDRIRERGYKSVHFMVNKYNIKAIRSYSHLDFNVVGECNLYDQEFLCYEKEL